MTTTMTQVEPAATGRAPRPLSIAANLLPAEIVDARRGRKLKRLVLSALLMFAVLLAGWDVQASYRTSAARSVLTGAEDTAERLLGQQRAFADVVSIQAESNAIRTQLGALLADDLQWSRLLAAVQGAAPGGVLLTGVTAALTPGTAGGAVASQAGQLPDTTGKKLIGTLTVSGSAASKAQVAAYVDALAKVPGLGNPLLGSANVRDGALQFSVRLDITAAALAGRYTPKGTTGSGGN
jgi:hypothetical protein